MDLELGKNIQVIVFAQFTGVMISHTWNTHCLGNRNSAWKDSTTFEFSVTGMVGSPTESTLANIIEDWGPVVNSIEVEIACSLTFAFVYVNMLLPLMLTSGLVTSLMYCIISCTRRLTSFDFCILCVMWSTSHTLIISSSRDLIKLSFSLTIR